MAMRIRDIPVILLLGAAACVSAGASSQNASGSAPSASAGALGSSWADAAKMPDLFTGMWMTFTPMTDVDPRLNVPYTKKAQAYVARYKPVRDLPYAGEGCRTPGIPVGMRSGPIKFTYAPGLLSIYMQGVGQSRFIAMNRQQGQTTPKYYGNSVGHWEGDTLVIETADFVPEISFQYGVGKGLPELNTFGPAPGGPGGPGGPGPAGPGPGPRPGGQAGPPGAAPAGPGSLSKAIWGPHGPKMRMVERLRLLDPNKMELKLTVYDDSVWTQPFQSQTRVYGRIVNGNNPIFTGEPEEWVCTVAVTTFDSKTNTYVDKSPEDMVKLLDSLGR